ncbi:hypothetical protein [Evansella cellulosilytica]|uniref:Uncharacterized protein n=1 Tax=Evansella cellulosilytica (strain ATCC 21833 / DSM 2522 / FERM P-1141 / JCM 9156 / N-4) TaxID=649639 RepID=E6TUU5_EVAC2|nr:hypothetical protein [Evansella cellulosilytica]ADU32097.1 hypothetical protein Bcell_3858 [Evansella cellulosilytica DSM 2522]
MKTYEIYSKSAPITEQISEWLEGLDNLTSIHIQFSEFAAKVTYVEEEKEEE